MNKFAFRSVSLGLAASAVVVTLGMSSGLVMAAPLLVNGAGSSFIYPVLSKWTATYHQKTSQSKTPVLINYQPNGSTAGVRNLQDGSVTFAASDIPNPVSALTKQNWVQFPMIVGGVVPILNVKGIQSDQLVLDGKTLADIYLGKIKRWDDPAIKALNPALKLPSSLIMTVRRADGSGTTFNFKHYLSQVDSSWLKQGGDVSPAPSWPSAGIGGKGNAGVASLVQNTPNSIGYVEYAYAIENHLTVVKLKNRSGQVVSPSSSSFAAAVSHADWQASDGFGLVLTDQPGAASWPIVATTYILFPKKEIKTKQGQAAMCFFSWAYHHGESTASQLNYVSIPEPVYQKIEAYWTTMLPEFKLSDCAMK